MTQQAAMRELRSRLGVDRVRFAALLGFSAASVERYEAIIPRDLAERMAAVAGQHGHKDLQDYFLGVGIDDEVAAPRHSSAEIKRLLAWWNNPRNDLEKGLKKAVAAVLFGKRG